MALPTQEGFVSFRGYDVWYRIVGDCEESGKLPLLCLHGGPGFVWDPFEPLEGLAATGRCVVFYDQLGCGNSNVPTDPSIYTMALHLEEVGAVRRAFGLDRVHILGHSWGGMLAMEYALTQPAGLASLILADSDM
jgi:proline-specific peptidase